ncbi:hypothetical protein GF327_09835 [Candidatus Woesearchaeota archaeon]|nr:hypothetical protein [Candidatus Woesearchaeota archaeon]
MAKHLKFDTTKDIKISKDIINQVIGQDEAVDVIRKAAEQRRHVLLIGEPGTGKSMLGLALAELLPKEKLVDVISFPNPNDENQPLIRTMSAGKGREFVTKAKMQTMSMFKNQNIIMIILALVATILPYYFWKTGQISDIIYAATMVTGMVFIFGVMFMINFGKKMEKQTQVPKVIVDNYGRKQAPFFDATGAHAGALLGDVLHDPFQSHYPDNCIYYTDNKLNIKKRNLKMLTDNFWTNLHLYKEVKENKNYEAVFLPKNELQVLGKNNNSVSPVEVLSSNRYDYEGEMIKLTISKQKKLIVTPEHKIAVQRNEKTQYIEASKLTRNDEILSLNENVIIDEQDIFNTYNVKQQEQCKLYYQYLEIKKQNPTWGYKRIAKAMGQKYAKTRWWHAGKHKPVPVQTAEWLKQRGLLPLTYDNPKIQIIAKILGATLGDGGIFENLNGIFLSSKEKSNVLEFQKDLEKIFGLDKGENLRIIEGGEFGHSWCYQNTNRKIIRFFIAIKSPVGKKSSQELTIPGWIYKKNNLTKEFFASLLGSEAGIPKVHVSKIRLNTFDFAISGEEGLKQNRINFLEKIKNYLASVDVKTGKISTRKIRTKKSDKGSILYRFMISTEFQNLINFSKNCKINYCNYKKEKLTKTINKFRKIKKQRYDKLISEGYGAESAMNQLNLSPRALYEILNDTEFIVKERKSVYA